MLRRELAWGVGRAPSTSPVPQSCRGTKAVWVLLPEQGVGPSDLRRCLQPQPVCDCRSVEQGYGGCPRGCGGGGGRDGKGVGSGGRLAAGGLDPCPENCLRSVAQSIWHASPLLRSLPGCGPGRWVPACPVPPPPLGTCATPKRARHGAAASPRSPLRPSCRTGSAPSR